MAVLGNTYTASIKSRYSILIFFFLTSVPGLYHTFMSETCLSFLITWTVPEGKAIIVIMVYVQIQFIWKCIIFVSLIMHFIC